MPATTPEARVGTRLGPFPSLHGMLWPGWAKPVPWVSRHSPLSLDLWTSTQGIQQRDVHKLISVLLTEKWAHLQSIPSGLPDSWHPYKWHPQTGLCFQVLPGRDRTAQNFRSRVSLPLGGYDGSRISHFLIPQSTDSWVSPGGRCGEAQQRPQG